MVFTLRVDLDYVPWDTPDAQQFGHGEPAVVMRLLDIARFTGYKFHFFSSNRSLRALPTLADAVLNDGHDLDWLCKHPLQGEERFAEAKTLFGEIGHTPKGLATKQPWPDGDVTFEGIETLQFLSAPVGPVPAGLELFPIITRPDREAFHANIGARSWSESVKLIVRESASLNRSVTCVVRPQVLAKFDPKLTHIKEILDLADAVGLENGSLRDRLLLK